MARGKKNEKELTIEERLEQALVPVEEQPYSVPENWCWTTIEYVATVITGGTPSKKISEYYGSYFPFFKPADLDAGRYVYESSEYLSEKGRSVSRIIPAHSTAVCCIGSIGKSGYLMVEGTTNQQINSAIPRFNSLYFFYYANTDCFINQLLTKASATTIAIVNKSKMEQCYFPLAPLTEQQRIVARIESLFAKLDEAKEKAQAVVDGFEARKAAILHKAFTGELTAKWRQENGITLDNWNLTSLSEVVSDFKYGTSEKSDYNNSGMPVFRIPNVTDGELDFSDMKYLKDWSISEESQIHENDILIIRSNGSRNLVGKSVLVPKLNQLYAYASFLIRIRVTEKILPEYLVRYLNSSDGRYQMFNKAKSSAGINNINSKELGAIILRLPTIYEQKKIVGIIDSLFIKEQQAKETAEAVLDQIEAMKESILARAFRGELGTNDPAEESAVELLKKII